MNATRRSTRAAATENNENATRTRTTRAGKAVLVDVDTKPTKTALGTRKRAALGEVTNVHVKEAAVANGKENGKVAVEVKPRVTRTRSTIRSKKEEKEEVQEEEKVTRKRTAPVMKKERSTVSTKSATSAEPEVIEAPPTKKVKSEAPVEEEPAPWAELDADDAHDPLMVAEYVEDIFEYMKDLEQNTLPNPNYMSLQKELAWNMRGILVDWLIQVHTKFRLLPETLFLAVNIIDRFLSRRFVALTRLQLVGVTALFIAAKYEEIMAPSVQNFLYMTDSGWVDEDILKAERYVLQVLDFNLSYPNPLNFLRRISKADNYDIQTRTVAKYLMEISLLEHRLLEFPPSQIAAASMYLARLTLNRSSWDVNFVHYSGYTEAEIVPVTEIMMEYLYGPVKHEAFYKKYANKKFLKASIFVSDWVSKLEDDPREERAYGYDSQEE
ncbi:G2/mitotic-specific cyclin [Saitoella coloradoensis]